MRNVSKENPLKQKRIGSYNSIKFQIALVIFVATLFQLFLCGSIQYLIGTVTQSTIKGNYSHVRVFKISLTQRHAKKLD